MASAGDYIKGYFDSWKRGAEHYGGEIKNFLSGGDPNAVKHAYDDMMAKASQMTADTRNYLGGQETKALAAYQPMQRMFAQMYGTNGIAAPQVPRAAGSPLSSTYGGSNGR